MMVDNRNIKTEKSDIFLLETVPGKAGNRTELYPIGREVEFFVPPDIEEDYDRFVYPCQCGLPLTEEQIEYFKNVFAVAGGSVKDAIEFRKIRDSIYIVSESVKKLIEKVEPDVHFFSEIDIFYKEEMISPPWKSFVFYSSQRIDFLDKDATRCVIDQGHFIEDEIGHLMSDHPNKIFVHEDKTAGCHIWRDSEIPIEYYLSKQMRDLFEKDSKGTLWLNRVVKVKKD